MGSIVRVGAICAVLMLASRGTAFAQAESAPSTPVAEELRKALDLQAPQMDKTPSFPSATTPSLHDRALEVRPKTQGLKAALPQSLKNRIHAAAMGFLRAYVGHAGEGHGFGDGPHGGHGGEHHEGHGPPEGGERGEHGGPNMPRTPHHDGAHEGAGGGRPH